jgi:hypothetical protein
MCCIPTHVNTNDGQAIVPNQMHVQGDAAKAGFISILAWARLLTAAPAQSFPNYAQFLACCTSGSESITNIASSLSKKTCLACNKSSAPGEGDGPMLAHVRGQLRRLCEPDEDFFNTDEYNGMVPTHCCIFTA